MSSPKRAAKIVAKAIVAKNAARSAAKSAAKLRPVVARPPLKPTEASSNGASVDAKKLAAVLERGIVDGKLDMVTAEALQKLIAAACRVYTARLEAGEQFMPIPKNSISATDVMVTASGLLKAADLAVFELGMWQSWTGR
jgi:hypothetical protein